MLRYYCDTCPNQIDCFDYAACLHSVIDSLVGAGVTEYPPETEYGSDYTDAADLSMTPIVLPKNEDSSEEDW